MSFKIAMMDLAGNGKAWLDLHAENVELIECVSSSGNIEGTISLKELSMDNRWDYFLIFVDAKMEEKIQKLLTFYEIPMSKVIFPLDIWSLVEHRLNGYSMFDDEMRRLTEFYEFYLRQEFCSVQVEGGPFYVGRTTDFVIMKHMYVHGTNWAEADIKKYYELSQSYYHFGNKQELFCDIGANIGTTCIYFKKMMEPDVKILALEAMPDTYKLLIKNNVLNDIAENERNLINIGISDCREEIVFHYHLLNPGASSFLQIPNEATSVTVPTISFDELLEIQKINPEQIKYIWVDLEGYEWAFVAGAKKTLSMINVPIVMEVTPEFLRKQNKSRQFYDDLKELYRRYVVMSEESIREHEIEELETFLVSDPEAQPKDLFFLK